LQNPDLTRSPPLRRCEWPPLAYWKYGLTPAGSGVLSSATIIDEI
jgi:hypothetical protein